MPSTSETIYRQHTHAVQYLDFASNHQLEHKLSVVKIIHYRARTVMSKEEDRRSEVKHVKRPRSSYG